MLDHSVTTRISRYTYGVESSTKYDSNDPEHVSRQQTRFTKPSGRVSIPGIFCVILEKVIVYIPIVSVKAFVFI
jgi:hypothetical protein